MNWPVRALLGPMLWAVAFVVIYAVHGLGCALNWPTQPAPWGDLHRFVLILLWGVSLAGAALILWLAPAAHGTSDKIVRAGNGIGFAAILLTLFPVLGLTTCG